VVLPLNAKGVLGLRDPDRELCPNLPAQSPMHLIRNPDGTSGYLVPLVFQGGAPASHKRKLLDHQGLETGGAEQ
jgi:hypothetical protein